MNSLLSAAELAEDFEGRVTDPELMQIVDKFGFKIGRLIVNHLNISTIAELCRFRRDEILSVPGIGEASMKVIELALDKEWLSLSTHPRSSSKSTSVVNRGRNYSIICDLMDGATMKACADKYGVQAPGIRSIYEDTWMTYAYYVGETTRERPYSYAWVFDDKDEFGETKDDLAIKKYRSGGKYLTDDARQALLNFAKEYYLQ